jgi:hypothetical protein
MGSGRVPGSRAGKVLSPLRIAQPKRRLLSRRPYARISARFHAASLAARTLQGTMLVKDDLYWLTQLFAFTRKHTVAVDERRAMIRDLQYRILQWEDTLPAARSSVKGRKGGCRIFGERSARRLAELMIADIERMVVSTKSFENFCDPNRAHGYRSRLRGKLFHLFVRNFAPIQNDFLQLAELQVQELNEPPLPLLTANEKEYSRVATFGRPFRAQNIRIAKFDGTVVDFVDDLYVAAALHEGNTLWSFLVEIEVKTAGAASRFGRQIGFSQSRMGAENLKHIEMNVDGYTNLVVVKPEHLLFSRTSILRHAVTFLSRKAWLMLPASGRADLENAIQRGDMERIYRSSNFRYQGTQLGQRETFCRVELAVPIDLFEGYVAAIWPYREM